MVKQVKISHYMLTYFIGCILAIVFVFLCSSYEQLNTTSETFYKLLSRQILADNSIISFKVKHTRSTRGENGLERTEPAQYADASKFHMLSVFIRPSEEEYLTTFPAFKEKREYELLYSLQENLKHPLVASITLFTNTNTTAKFLSNLELENRTKLVVHHVNDISNGNIMKYISDHFIGKIAVFANQDIYMKDGFEQVDVDYLKRENLTYALTRHNDPKYRCTLLDISAHCGTDRNRQASHDVFIFALKSEIPSEYLKYLDGVEQHQMGQENLLIWWFREKLGYRVSNPCKVLKFYHRHCFRINKPNKEASRDYIMNITKGVRAADFTDSLL